VISWKHFLRASASVKPTESRYCNWSSHRSSILHPVYGVPVISAVVLPTDCCSAVPLRFVQLVECAGVARGGLRGLGPQRMRKNIKASLVNLALNMRYKNDKKYQICHHNIRFFQAQNAPKSVFGRTPLGELTTLPQTP